MKFPQLRLSLTIFCVFLFGIPYLFGQVLSPPTLTSTHGSGPIISVCTSDTVTFTAAGDIGSTANDAEFKIIRAGVTMYPVGGAPGPQAILSFSSPNLQNGDQVVATVWTYDYGPSGGVSALTNTITIALGGYPEPVAFTSDTTGNTVCINQTVQLSASTVSTLTMFEFFVDGISIQGPSLVSTLSHVFSTTSTATLIASVGGCSRSFELPIQLIDLTPGTITGGGEICFADIPTPITSLVTGTKDGVDVSTSTVTTFYQWQSSLDGVVWNNILGAQSIDYTPPSLNQTTHFRRKLVAVSGGKTCEAFSNQITIKVIPLIEAGYIEQADQFFCSGDVIPTLTVTQSTIAPGILYQWQQSVDDGISYSNISLAVASGYTPAGLTQTTLFRRATFTNSGSGCVSTTLPVQFILLDVNPGSLDVSQNRTICHGTAPPVLSNGATGAEAISVTGTTTYQWQQSLDNTNWSNIPLATSSSYAPPALTVSTYFRRAAITTSGSAQCSDTTNTLLISVYAEINAGTLLGDQILCENDLPTALSLSGTTSATGTSYQWQMSTDNVNFTTLTNSQPTLSFTTTTTAWNPTVTSYYRVLVRNFVSPGCVATSTTAEIIVNPAAQIIQTSGPGPQQEVCPGDAIINATFTLTGSATTLTAVGAGGGTGLSFTGPIGGVYTLSGTPTSDAVITITANAISPCNDVTYQYNVFQTTTAQTPSYIRKGTNTADDTVFQRGGLWYNNTLNQNPASSSITNFYACQNTTAVSVITHEWMVSPATAGSIDPSTGVMTWNPTFSGTAIVSVRSISCGGNSAWLDNSIEVIPSTIPATIATSLTEPLAFDLLFCDTETGAAPSCEITASAPNTRFFSTTAGGTSDYQSIQWSLQNVVPGGGLTGVTDPGTIDSATGEVNWNTGFYGSVDIQAQAINFDGSLGVVRSTTVQIGQMTDIAPNIITVSPSLIPSCPPQGSYQTDFRSNREVTWSLSNSNAGSISSTATNTARMTWADDFSGTVRIIATASGVCETGESELIAIIPGAASIQTLTGLDDVQLCEGENLVGIPYDIGGFPSSASVSGLPSGITGTLSATFHIVDVVYSGTSSANETYQLEILGQLYTYTTAGVETADQVVQGLANVVSASPTRIFDATHTGPNTLRLQPKVAGVSLSGTVFFGSVTVTIIPISSAQREFILSGVTTASPGEYVYTITTEGGEGFCQQASIQGKITVVGTSSLTLEVGSDDNQVVCDTAAIAPIIYEANYASFVIVDGLPAGVSYVASSTGVIISGTPTVNVTETTVYTYTVSTTNNIYGCSPEASITGQITVEPLQIIELSSALGTDNQTICNSGGVATLTPIEYTLDGGAIGSAPVVAGLPPGINNVYNSTNETLLISGVPNITVTTTTVYAYTVTTVGANCLPVVRSGSITVNPNPTISLTSAVGTDDQTGLTALCMGMAITPIQYTLNHTSSIVSPIIGLPNGLTVTQSASVVTISGVPNEVITTNQIYTYTISTDGSSCQPEATVTGQIELYPLHEISLTSLAGTDNQEVCNSGGVAPLTPIEYTMARGATDPPIVLGLPSGISSNYDLANRTVTISGTPTTKVAVQTIYNYTVTTVGVRCTPVVLSGSITVNPSPSITLSSAVGTDDQTGTSAICLGTAITPIQYTLANASSFVDPIPGLPNGLIVSQSGNVVTISGTPDVSINFTQVYNYTITTMGSACQPEASVTGQIEVIPNPQFDENYINANDVSHVSCPGSSDGAIRIPEEGSLLDLRIQGGQSPVAQVEELILSNQPALGDVYTLTINGIVYTHTVIASGFGGPVQTLAEVTTELVDLINNAIGSSESVVTASYSPASSIRLVADTPGMAFSIGTNVSTTLTGVASPVITTNQITANLSTNYAYLWTGPSGFSSSDLQIENLGAGDYTLRVSVGICSFSEATFTINEPEPITAINEVCGGSFKTTLSGGTGPYTLMLHDELGNLLRTDTTNSIYIYSGLTPGANYRLDVVDSNCAIPTQFAISLPFELQYNPANVVLTHDYCQQAPNTGEGSIVLGTVVGNAFTGGSGNFSYRWSGPTGNLITRDIQSLVAGDYTVTVTDNELGCSRSETFTVASNSPLNLTLAGSSVLNGDGEIELSCADDTSGEIQLSVTGGFGVYTYAWEKDGDAIANNTNRIQNISAGQYSVTVTDVPPGGIDPNSLCQLTQTFTVVAPPLLTLSLDQNSITQPNCSGETINIPVVVSGGNPPYEISLNGGMTISTSSPTYLFENLNPTELGNTVTITLEDTNGCSASPVSLSVNVPKQYSFEGTVTDIDCRINTLGGIQLLATQSIAASDVLIVEWRGDALHFFDTWTNGQGALSDITNPGTYTVSVSTQLGCVLYSSSFEVKDATGMQLKVEILKEISSTSCNENEGRIDLGISSGYPPYNIQWERISGQNTWTILSEYTNQAIVTGLASGTYRAIVSDSSQATNTKDCQSVITTRRVVLSDQRLSFTNVESESTSILCSQNNSGQVRFQLQNTLTFNDQNNSIQFKYFIDDVEILTNSDQFSFNEHTSIYQISGIDQGLHTLKVDASTVSFSCSIEEEFSIEETTKNQIQYTGPSQYNIDVCDTSTTIEVETNDISGGSPYQNSVPYDLEWNFHPNLSSNTVSQTFYGYTINNVLPGIYELIITDSNGCQNNQEIPILIEVIAPEVDPITIEPNLIDPNGDPDVPVNVISLQCENSSGGEIGVTINGGLRPFEINWFKQDPSILSSLSNTDQGFVLLPQFKNQTFLNNLDAGMYRVEVASLNDNCEGEGSVYTFASQDIEVIPNPDLYILSGPFIENQDLCNGLPGKVTVEIFDNNQGELFFYYEEVLLEKDENQRTPNTYTLLVENPVPSGTLKIVNEEGCTIEKKIDLALGEASFTFTSVSKEASGVILARENVTFENTSALPYSHFEFYYGDNSEPYLSREDTTSATVTVNRIPPHQYPTSGTYNAILKVYNNSGCFSEEVLPVPVGNGYSVQLPNVFTPNNDGVNDVFRPLTSGLTKIEFSIYDYNGSLIYTETVVSDSDSFVKLEETLNDGGIKGWDGADASPSPYYVYSVRGTLADQVTQVERSGTFTLIR